MVTRSDKLAPPPPLVTAAGLVVYGYKKYLAPCLLRSLL
jgi:hypothetical protein